MRALTVEKPSRPKVREEAALVAASLEAEGSSGVIWGILGFLVRVQGLEKGPHRQRDETWQRRSPHLPSESSIIPQVGTGNVMYKLSRLTISLFAKYMILKG